MQAEVSPEFNLELITAPHIFIGLIYFEGKDPTIDIVNTYKWLYIATSYEQPYPQNSVFLWPTPKHIIDDLNQLMTLNQIKEATLLADIWIAEHPL